MPIVRENQISVGNVTGLVGQRLGLTLFLVFVCLFVLRLVSPSFLEVIFKYFK